MADIDGYNFIFNDYTAFFYFIFDKIENWLLLIESITSHRVNHCNHVKIADFGLACDMLDGKVYYAVTKPLPTRWLAPESVAFRRFTLQSDVVRY